LDFLYRLYRNDSFFIRRIRTSICRLDNLPSVICNSRSNSRLRYRYDVMVSIYGVVYCTIVNGIIKLCGYGFKFTYKRYVYDSFTFNNMGIMGNSNHWYRIVPGIIISSIVVNYGQKLWYIILLV